MKCHACHHLNADSEAECFMCGARLYRGAPPAHGAIFVFVALCILIPVINISGAATGIISLISPSQTVKISGTSAFIAYIFGFLGLSVCLTVSRTQLPKNTQLLTCGIVTGFCWFVYLLTLASLAKETQKPKRILTYHVIPLTVGDQLDPTTVQNAQLQGVFALLKNARSPS